MRNRTSALGCGRNGRCKSRMASRLKLGDQHAENGSEGRTAPGSRSAVDGNFNPWFGPHAHSAVAVLHLSDVDGYARNLFGPGCVGDVDCVTADVFRQQD